MTDADLTRHAPRIWTGHDPYRGHRRPGAPQVDVDAAPVDGPVRVVAYVDRYPPVVNAGAEWYLHAVMRHLATCGHESVVVTDTPDRYVLEGVAVHPVADLDEMVDVADVLVGHLLWTRQVVNLASARQLPLVYVLHNDMQVAHWQLRPEQVTVLVHNSRWVEARFDRWQGPTAVVRPACLLDDYRLDGDAFGREFVTLVNPTPDKGSPTLYRVAAREHRRRFATVAGGYGQQLRPPRDVRNVERLPSTPSMRDDVYARTRVLFVPSRYESWGRVAVEAMCAGIPVVAHPTDGLVEACGDAGWFVDRDDIDGWVAALHALDDRATFAEWSARARDRAAFLHGQSLGDLAVWERVIRTAASARLRSGA